SQPDFPSRLVGYLAEDETDGADANGVNDGINDIAGLNLPLLGTAVDVARLAGLHQINRVIVAISDRRGHLPIQELLRAKLSGVRVEDAATAHERITGKSPTDGLTPSRFSVAAGFRAGRTTRAFERVGDAG